MSGEETESGADPQLEQLADRLADFGSSDSPTSEEIAAVLDDPARADAMMQLLRERGLDQIGQQPLMIEDHYREGTDLFELRWPIQDPGARLLPFDALDRKTQFFVLFQEWTRRDLEAIAQLNSGETSEAQALYEECVERATQLEVPELLARSYEGLMRVAEKQGDRREALRWVTKASETRKGGLA